MKVIDLSHTVHMEMPVYPGTEQPVFTQANTFDRDGFLEKKITMYSHTGTHIDAPAHILKDGITLDKYPINHFVGIARVLNFENKSKVGLEDLIEYKSQIEGLDYLIIKTGWAKLWGRDSYFEGYPLISDSAADWLANSFKLKGIGIDTISIDPEYSSDFSKHKIFLNRKIVIIENLNNLELVPEGEFIFSCLPLKIIDADGSPVRAVAIITS